MDARFIMMERYWIDPNYVKKVKKEIYALLKVGFFIEVGSNEWLCSIVVVLKKNGKLKICIDLKKLNEKIIKGSFSLSFINKMLNKIAKARMYSIVDGYSGHDQISLVLEDS